MRLVSVLERNGALEVHHRQDREDQRLQKARDQAEGHQRVTPQDGVRAAEEGSAPAVLALLDRAVEELRLAAERVVGGKVPEPLGRLDEGLHGLRDHR